MHVCKGSPGGEHVRIWSTGCRRGQEQGRAYPWHAATQEVAWNRMGRACAHLEHGVVEGLAALLSLDAKSVVQSLRRDRVARGGGTMFPVGAGAGVQMHMDWGRLGGGLTGAMLPVGADAGVGLSLTSSE
eukprot:352440-Chlamydomonas_euryale.AAC.2